MMKKIITLMIICILVIFSACRAASFRDGTYEGRSTDDSRGAYGTVSLEVKDGKIDSVAFIQYNGDGTTKGEKYGEEAGPESYKKAQDALKYSEKYPEKLVETQDVDKVDAVTGATTSWKQFTEAARDALAKAK